MLTENELFLWFERLNLPESARSEIKRIRSSQPYRKVRSGRGNVSANFPSRKMGVTIQAESHKVALAGVRMYEVDDDVLEFYDETGPIKLAYEAKSGLPTATLHTPDYFTIRSLSAGWEEWKPEDKLEELAIEKPNRYMRDDSGKWRCLPGEEYAQALGLYYRLRSSAEINWNFQQNFQILWDYLDENCPPVRSHEYQSICSFIHEHPGITLADFLQEKPTSITIDHIYTLIAKEEIYVDLYKASLAEPERVRIFANAETATALEMMLSTTIDRPEIHDVDLAPGKIITWDGQQWTIINAGVTDVTLLTPTRDPLAIPREAFLKLVSQGQIIGVANDHSQRNLTEVANELLLQASPDDLEIANNRYAQILPLLNGEKNISQQTPERTLRDWKAKYLAAEQGYGNGYVGLLPRYAHSGNRDPRFPESTYKLMNEVIEQEYENAIRKNKVRVWGSLQLRCKAEGLICPSYTTFSNAVDARPQHEQQLARSGPRAAYTSEPVYWELTPTTPRHGLFPLHIVHIDHTELDLELVHSVTGQNMGRAYGTIVTCTFTRRILLVFLSYDAPGTRTCMMALRELVKRYGRFPQILVVDGGKDFNSVYFDSLVAMRECTKFHRPGAKPRFGTVIERLFGTSNTEFVHNLIGNTQNTRKVRQLTKSFDPKNSAIWPLKDFLACFQQWAYETYDTIQHEALGQTPRDAFNSNIHKTGERPHKLIPYDEAFIISTFPTTRKGKAKIQPNQGIKIRYRYFWNDAMRNAKIENQTVPIRYDPYNAGIAYAYIGKQWLKCISEHYAIFQGRSDREVQLATAELIRQKQLHRQNFQITAAKIAEFLTSVEAQQLLLMQRLHDGEMKEVFQSINAPALEPIAEFLQSEPLTIYSSSHEGTRIGTVIPEDIDISVENTYEDF